jgi:kynurenine formamidase
MNHALKPGGEPSWRIDEVPLEWFFQPAVKLDSFTCPTATSPPQGDIEAELHRIGHTLRPLEIVVVNTSAAAKYRADYYVDLCCGMGKAATLRMLECGVHLVGTDSWSWDAPFSLTRNKVAQTGDAGLIWEGHRAGRKIGYSHLKNLHNLEQLPVDGFEVVCFPVKVHRAPAG